jgi:hypothetical protein
VVSVRPSSASIAVAQLLHNSRESSAGGAVASKKTKRATRKAGSIPPTLARSYERYLKIALALPGAAASPGPGSAWDRGRRAFETPSVRVFGKLLSRWRTEAEGALAIRCDLLDRQILLQARPDVFFLIDHYVNYPMVLVRIENASPAVLRDVTERAWRLVAPQKAVKQREAALASSKR